MRALFIVGFTFFSFCTFAQTGIEQKKTKTYLIASFEMRYDKANKQYFQVIQPQKGVNPADEVYALLNYNIKTGVINENGAFYHKSNDEGKKLYNYFTTTTEGLNYMASRGWSVISVYQEISSDAENKLAVSGDVVPVAAVSSKPVFVFAKD